MSDPMQQSHAKIKSLLSRFYAGIVLLGVTCGIQAGTDVSGKIRPEANRDANSQAAVSARPAASNDLQIIEIGGRKASATSILAKLKSSDRVPETAAARARSFADLGLEVDKKFESVPGLQSFTFNQPATAARASADALVNRIESLRKSGLFEYVEPNWVVNALQATSDSAFADGTLWGLHNTGQDGGVAGIDINSVSAWDIETGADNVVVAVIDTGIRYTHQDLSGNMWVNQAEIPGNGLDDDGNGYIDDVHGINAIDGSGDPFDDDAHGTHVAGTIGATANDGGAHVGVAHNVSLMALKFLTAAGGTTADAIECIDYAVSHGAHILNNSWGGGGYSQALVDAIEAANQADVLFVAAAGNGASNNDDAPAYPASYEHANIITVAAIDRFGDLAHFSSYGFRSVDIAAPGVEIFSTTSLSDRSYTEMNGTSMATPHVAGAAALLKAQNFGSSALAIKNKLINSALTMDSLFGRVATGGTLDALAALSSAPDGLLELSASSESNSLPTDARRNFYITVSDIDPVIGAMVSGNFFGTTAKNFADDGLDPDVSANDGIYSATLTTPPSAGNANLSIDVSASGKVPASASFKFQVISDANNDDFADRIALVAGTSQTAGSNYAANRQPGEPTNPRGAGGKSVWWEWTAAISGDATISTAGSNFDTTLAIYRGTNLSALRLIGSNDDSNGLQSALTFAAVAGATYQIQVDGYAGDEGEIQLGYPPPNPGSSGIPFIISQPVSRDVLTGQPLELRVIASGRAMLHYQWSLNGVPIAGATSSDYFIGIAGERDEGIYTVEISNALGSVRSDPAFVSVNPIALIPGPDDFASAEILEATSGSVSGSNVLATAQFGEPDHARASFPVASVWYRWTAPSDGVLTVDTGGSDYDTTLALYSGAAVDALNELDSNDDGAGLGLQSIVSSVVTSGSTYSITVDGFADAQGLISLSYVFVPFSSSVDNDDFADRIVISGASLSATGDNIGAGSESGEPIHAEGASAPLASVWWTWQSPGAGEVVISTEGSNFDTTLAVYRGKSLRSLVEVASNDDHAGLTSQTRFSVSPGVDYLIAVDGYSVSEGRILLSVEFTGESEDRPVGESLGGGSGGGSSDVFLILVGALLMILARRRRQNGLMAIGQTAPAISLVTLQYGTRVMSKRPNIMVSPLTVPDSRKIALG